MGARFERARQFTLRISFIEVIQGKAVSSACIGPPHRKAFH